MTVGPLSTTPSQETPFYCAPDHESARPRMARRRLAKTSLMGGGMRVTWYTSSRLCLFGTAMLVVASCSEPFTSTSTVSPRTGRALSTVVGSFGTPAGALQQTINSGDPTVHYCG